MEDKTSIICITCPVGCPLQVSHEGRTIHKVEGNQCPRGLKYAESELTDPRRMLTTTVSVRGGIHPLVPVQTAAPIPRSQVPALLDELRRISLDAPVKMGQIVLKNALGTGVDVIASRNLEQITNKK